MHLTAIAIFAVSIPKRVSEVLKRALPPQEFERLEVSIPKRVSEVLKHGGSKVMDSLKIVSIPKRVSEVLKLIEL